MKKFITMSLLLLLILSLVACGNEKGVSQSSSNNGSAASSSEDHQTEVEKTVEWPTAKNITIVCAAKAGGNTDAQCRIFADYMNRTYSGHNFVVENDGAGGGVSAFEKVRNGKPDGSYFLFYHNGLDIMHCIGRYDYSMSDFTILGKMVDEQNAYFLMVPATSKYKTVEDLVNDALKNPGKVTFGIQLAASRQMLIGSFLNATGTDINMIETGGEADTITQLMGGNVDFSFISYNNSKNYSEAGELRILAYCGDERLKSDPDIPTIKESYPKFENCFNIPFLLAPAGMDPALAKAINASFKEMGNDEAVRSAYGKMSQTFNWCDLDSVQAQFEQQLKVIETASKALGF